MLEHGAVAAQLEQPLVLVREPVPLLLSGQRGGYSLVEVQQFGLLSSVCPVEQS